MDAESLIAHLSGALHPTDRAAFRQAAENALATSPICLGPGSIHRIVVSIWRIYFRAPREDRPNTWTTGQKNASKLITEPPRDGHRRRRRFVASS
jgi:hypothetical protein